MSNITQTLRGKKNFIAFVTAGDPDLICTERYIRVMAEAGADLIEIGVPFSDPIAEGPVIQASNIRALKNRVTLNDIFETVARVKRAISVPIVLLTYLNPVFRYGYESFFDAAKQSGVDGIIVPDCPYEEKGEFADVAEKYGVDVITLVAPTSDDRIARLAKEATGFVYLVSSMGVTGVRSRFSADLRGLCEKIRAYTNIPICVGFGIGTPEQAAEAVKVADGAIVGSAIVQIVKEYGAAADQALYAYVRAMKAAVTGAIDG